MKLRPWHGLWYVHYIPMHSFGNDFFISYCPRIMLCCQQRAQPYNCLIVHHIHFFAGLMKKYPIYVYTYHICVPQSTNSSVLGILHHACYVTKQVCLPCTAVICPMPLQTKHPLTALHKKIEYGLGNIGTGSFRIRLYLFFENIFLFSKSWCARSTRLFSIWFGK